MSYEEEEKTKKERKLTKEKTVDIKVNELVKDKLTLKEDGKTVCEVSSIGLSLELDNLGKFKKRVEELHKTRFDEVDMNKVVINYKDGSKYVVYDEDGNIDNTDYLCAGMNEPRYTVRMTFNRMIDTSKIKNVTVNDDVIEVKN